MGRQESPWSARGTTLVEWRSRQASRLGPSLGLGERAGRGSRSWSRWSRWRPSHGQGSAAPARTSRPRKLLQRRPPQRPQSPPRDQPRSRQRSRDRRNRPRHLASTSSHSMTSSSRASSGTRSSSSAAGTSRRRSPTVHDLRPSTAMAPSPTCAAIPTCWRSARAPRRALRRPTRPPREPVHRATGDPGQARGRRHRATGD